MQQRSLPYPLTGKQAWAAVFALVATHEITANKGQLLSEEVDRQLIKHPLATIGFGLVTMGHLYNLLPPQIDPYHWFGELVVFLKRKAMN